MMASPAPHTEPWNPDIRVRLYLWLSATFVTCLVLANVLGVKLFRFDLELPGLGPIKVEHTTGMLTFPITFLLTDLLNEYYGKRGARRVTYIAFGMGALAFVFIWVSRKFPILEGIPGTATNQAYENIFGAAALMYIASLIAFLFGSLLDIVLFAVFKRATRGRMVWLRATGSTVISQFFDSFIVTWVFFWAIPLVLGADKANFGFVISTAATGYILKFFIAVGLTPFIYLGRWLIRTQLGIQPLPAV
jgi:queuosine precursor transporter